MKKQRYGKSVEGRRMMYDKIKICVSMGKGD